MTTERHSPQPAPPAALSHDSFLDGRVQISQPTDGYRIGTDAVLLAASVQLAEGAVQRVLDMGAGVGAVSLAVRCRRAGGHFTAIEKDALCLSLLQTNIAANKQADFIRAVGGDITAMPPVLKHSFDQVIANPPFHHDSDQPPRSRRRSLAHNGDGAGLGQWVASGLWALRPKGRISFIVRADRTDEVMAALRTGGAGEILLFPVWSFPGSPAVRMIITARKGVKGAMALLSGLVLHHPSGALTDEAQRILKGGGLVLQHPATRHLRA